MIWSLVIPFWKARLSLKFFFPFRLALCSILQKKNTKDIFLSTIVVNILIFCIKCFSYIWANRYNMAEKKNIYKTITLCIEFAHIFARIIEIRPWKTKFLDSVAASIIRFVCLYVASNHAGLSWIVTWYLYKMVVHNELQVGGVWLTLPKQNIVKRLLSMCKKVPYTGQFTHFFFRVHILIWATKIFNHHGCNGSALLLLVFLPLFTGWIFPRITWHS